MATFTVAASAASAPYLVAGGAAYATLQGGKIAARKSTPYVIAVAKDARQRSKDIRNLVAVMRRSQMQRLLGSDATASAGSDSGPNDRPHGRWSMLSNRISRVRSGNAQETDTAPQLMTFEEAAQFQKEQQRSGTSEAFDFFPVHITNEAGENDLSNPWLRVDGEGTPLPAEDVDDGWVDIAGTGPSKMASVEQEESADSAENEEDSQVAQPFA